MFINAWLIFSLNNAIEYIPPPAVLGNFFILFHFIRAFHTAEKRPG